MFLFVVFSLRESVRDQENENRPESVAILKKKPLSLIFIVFKLKKTSDFTVTLQKKVASFPP